MREGDEVVVNVAALDLGSAPAASTSSTSTSPGVWSGGGGGRSPRDEAQLHLAPAPGRAGRALAVDEPGCRRAAPVSGPGAAAARAPGAGGLGGCAGNGPGVRLGFVQTGGGALPGSLSRDVAELRERGSSLRATSPPRPAYGGEHEALSTVGALDAAATASAGTPSWSARPGIIGSETNLGHGGMAALDSAHAALSLGLPTIVSPRLSPRTPASATAASATTPHASSTSSSPRSPSPSPTARTRSSTPSRRRQRPPPHRAGPCRPRRLRRRGLPTHTMGRGITEDPLFFAAPLPRAGSLPARGRRPPSCGQRCRTVFLPRSV